MKKVHLLFILLSLFISAPCFAQQQRTDNQAIWDYCEEVRSVADPLTENMLLMLNDGNYDQYTRDFNKELKAAVPKAKFKEMDSAIKEKYGEYISKEFLNIELREKYIMVVYKGNFSQEKEPVLIRSVFVQEAGKTYIAGFWLSPLKLVGSVRNQ